MEDPKRTYWQCIASVCSHSAPLGDLGVSRSTEDDSLSVLSIYPEIFLSALFVSCVIRDTLLLLSSAFFFCVLVR